MPNVPRRRFVPNPAKNRPSHIMIKKKYKCQQFYTGTGLSRPYLLISYTRIISLLVFRQGRPHFSVKNIEFTWKKNSWSNNASSAGGQQWNLHLIKFSILNYYMSDGHQLDNVMWRTSYYCLKNKWEIIFNSTSIKLS